MLTTAPQRRWSDSRIQDNRTPASPAWGAQWAPSATYGAASLSSLGYQYVRSLCGRNRTSEPHGSSIKPIGVNVERSSTSVEPESTPLNLENAVPDEHMMAPNVAFTWRCTNDPVFPTPRRRCAGCDRRARLCIRNYRHVQLGRGGRSSTSTRPSSTCLLRCAHARPSNTIALLFAWPQAYSPR